MKRQLMIIAILTFTVALSTACGTHVREASPFSLPAPNIVSPKEAAIDIELSPCFRWASVIAASNYEFLLVGEEGEEVVDLTGMKVLGDVRSYCYEDELEYGSYYVWSVRGINPDLELDGEWAIASFYTVSSVPAIPQPPAMPRRVKFSGHGDDVSSKFELVEGIAIFDMEHNGNSNFAIWLLNSSGEYVDLLVNEIGPYNGRKAIGVKEDNIIGGEPGEYILSISADGDWTVIITYEE